jgi:hypothetical protein
MASKAGQEINEQNHRDIRQLYVHPSVSVVMLSQIPMLVEPHSGKALA